jgi:hypothetical protein
MVKEEGRWVGLREERVSETGTVRGEGGGGR